MDHRPLTPGFSKMVGLEPICLRASELGSYRSGSTLSSYIAKLPFLRVNEVEPSNAFLLRTYKSLLSDLGLFLTRVESVQEL